MNQEPNAIIAGLEELLEIPDIAGRIGARWIIRAAINYLEKNPMETQLQQEVQRLTNTLHQVQETVDRLIDIARASIQLIETTEDQRSNQTLASYGGPYGHAYDNLKDAVNTYQHPNGWEHTNEVDE